MSNIPYYITIPGYVVEDSTLTPNCKLMFGIIANLCNTTGECWATNGYLSNIVDVDKKTVSEWVAKLELSGHIKTRLEYNELGQITARFINILIPIRFLPDTPIPPKTEILSVNNNKEDINKEYTTSQTTKIVGPELVKGEGKVNWEDCKNDLQRFIAFYIRNWDETLYKDGKKDQVSAFYAMYGKQFSLMLRLAGSLEIACNTVVYFDRHFKKQGWSWNLKTLSTNFPEFVNYAMQKQKEEVK